MTNIDIEHYYIVLYLQTHTLYVITNIEYNDSR